MSTRFVPASASATDAIWRLVYVSRNEIAGPPEEVRDEIARILAVARRANDAVDVCGALLFNHDCFAQTLEGPQDAVQSTFERIQCDPRHSHVMILGFDAVAERTFDAWSMAYVGEDPALERHFADLEIASGFDSVTISADAIHAVMRTHLLESEARGTRQRAT